MKLTTITMVTVDGVMQGLAGADEDRRGGFERGGWVTSVFDNEAMAFLNQVYQRADAFLFGRRTYEIFARSWGAWPDPGDHPIWKALNTQPKYVASTTLTEPRWANTTVLSGDVGQGTRLFPDIGPDIALDVVDSRVTPKGVTIQIYRPTGRPQYATATPT